MRFLWLLLAGALGALAQTPERPSIILILADDQGYYDLGVQGHPSIRTPNIDRMAAEGIRFTDFYAQPFCGPSRAAIMTGSYPARVSLAFNHVPRAQTGIHPNEVTVAEILKGRGYATMIAGKWHLGDATPFRPLRHGFDHWLGLPYSNDMWPNHPKVQRTAEDSELKTAMRARADFTGYDGKGQTYPLDWFPDLPLYRDNEVAELNPDQRYLTSRYADEVLAFIEENKEGPFFAYLAQAMPHVPLFRHPDFEGRSRRGLYGDVVEEIDHQVGRILSKLRETGLDKKTLVIYTSDNGPWVQYGVDAGSAGPLRGSKSTNYEGGVRVPCIWWFPGQIPAGQVSSQIAANLDFLPTFAHLAGAKPPNDRVIDGVNLWPHVTTPGSQGARERMYFYAGGMRYLAAEGPPANDPRLAAVREGPWKLHLKTDGEKRRVVATELYHLGEDIGETLNRVDAESELVARMTAEAQKFNDELRRNTRPHGTLDGAGRP